MCDDISTIGDDEDEVFRVNRSLSVPLILSCAKLNVTESWARRLIMEDDRFPANFRDTSRCEHEEYYGFMADPSAKRDTYESRLVGVLAAGRNRCAYLSSPELLTRVGIDVYELLSNMRLLEMSIDYDPIRIDLANRSRGTAIPIEIRSLMGKLRFGLIARAQDSLTTALIMQSQNIFASQAHYLGLFRERIEEGLGIKLDSACNAFTLSQGEIDFDRYADLIRTDPVIASMRGLVDREYEGVIRLRYSADIDGVFNYGFDLALGLLEPAMLYALAGIKDVETLVTDGITIPKGNLYMAYQASRLMRPKVTNTDTI